MTENETIIKEVRAVFDGRDPLAEASRKMEAMSHSELTKLVLIASNRIGTLLKGGDYDDAMEAAISINYGVDTVFSAYEDAFLHAQTALSGAGTA